MATPELNFEISKMGKCQIPSPMVAERFLGDDERILYHSRPEEIMAFAKEGESPPSFELAGPRKKIFFDPKKLKCGIVTCGGLCPGLNDVIRAVVLSLHYHYGVKKIYGFQFGYEGLNPKYGHKPKELDTEMVDHIGELGGTILGSSRGPQPVSEMANTLEQLGIGILFAVGGDGTLRGAQAISEELQRRGHKISVIGVPKTIDNDISYIRNSFGFQTAASEARRIISVAHTEAKGARDGVGLVRVMGRDSGYIAAFAALADSTVNFCLIPEVPFKLEPFLAALKIRLEKRHHAVIVAAEGAGQDLLNPKRERDASGNVRHGDIGVFLRDQIKAYFNRIGAPIIMRYIDPSYSIRGVPANGYDSAFCLLLGHNAVHAGMTGRTNMVVGNWNHEFTHVPIAMAVSERKKIDPNEWLWGSVLSTTGQPRDLN